MEDLPTRGHRNPLVVAAAGLRRRDKRKRQGRTLIEGPNLLSEALGSGLKPEIVFGLGGDTASVALCRENDVEFSRVDQRALERLAGTKSPRGPIAVIAIPASSVDGERNLLVSWGVADPGNIGTMIRTAAAFGWDFGYSPGTADPWSPKVLRAGAGAHFRLAIGEVAAPADLQEAGYVTVATVVAGGVDPDEVPEARWAVLVGGEARGLPHSVVAECDYSTTVTMPGGFESLNAAIAAALVIYQLTR